jgi:ATP-dependent Clp protease adaptor protein ClpS
MPQTTTAPGTGTGTEAHDQDSLTPLYRVVLFDDNDHTYDYVIEMLQKIFIFTVEEAFLVTCELPQAEFARDQIHLYGPDWRLPRSAGSMSAIVEPVG